MTVEQTQTIPSSQPITAREAAALLDGCEYGEEGSRELFARMKAAGLVAIFGCSDDLMEMRGAVHDEVGFSAWFTPAGRLENDCHEDSCPYYRKLRNSAAMVEALWGAEPGISFIYRTAIPHETFLVMEGSDTYCRGIVFALADTALPAGKTEADVRLRRMAISLWSATHQPGGEAAFDALPPASRERWHRIAGFAIADQDMAR